MSKRIALSVVMMLAVAVILSGCATSGGGAAKGKSPEDSIKAQLENWKAAMLKKDLNGIMASFSEKFANDQWGDKAGAKSFISDAIDSGYLDGVEVNIKDAQIKVTGDKGTVYPIDISGSFGSLAAEITLAKEKAAWMVVSVDIAGL